MADRPDPERAANPHSSERAANAHSSERASAREEVVIDERVRAAYRLPSPADEPARARLLARLAADPSKRTGWRWWLAADAFRARPIWVAAAFAAVLAGGAWLGSRVTPRTANDAVAIIQSAADPTTAPVTFVLRAPGATRVSVVGDFNNWDASSTPMEHSGSGDLWVLSLRLPRGVHLYSFVLDGAEWRPDPSAPLAADDSFGGHNSVIVVDGAPGL
jgi:hypothetical protein